MSDYTGPGIYEIIPYSAQGMGLNVWNGSKAEGTEIKLYPRERGENSQFEIVAAGGTNGQAEKGDREYHIIAVHSGLYVTKKAGNGCVTTELRSPKNPDVRWKIARADNGAFHILNCDNQKELNVRKSGKGRSGTEVITYSLEQGDNTKFLLKAI